MIDLEHLREQPELYQKACDVKRIQISIKDFLELDKKYRQLKSDWENLRARQNQISKEVPKLKGEEKEKTLAEVKEIAQTLKLQAESLKPVEEEWQRIQYLLPGIPLPEVPEGKDDSENKQVWTWGEIPQFSFEPKSHAELGKKLNILDEERGVKVAGARSYFLKGLGARLQHAVLQCALDMLEKRGFEVFEPPHIVKYETMRGTSYFPGGEESAYHLDERDAEYYLLGTAEVPVASYHMDEILAETDLPKRYAGVSPCYRREAGTYGKDTQGVYRVHQFYKVEQVVICKNDAEESARFHKEILANAEALMQALKLPYRVVAVCTGDMGRGQVFKHDVEAWMPSRKGYGETHSCSTFHEFQSRRLNIRYKNAQGKNIFCHTLNNTCVASPRILIPILENNQNADGSITIPEVLRPYLGGRSRIE